MNHFEEHTDHEELCLFGVTTVELYLTVYQPIIDYMNRKYLVDSEIAELWYEAAEKTYEAYKQEFGDLPENYGKKTTTNEHTILKTASFLYDHYKEHINRVRH